MSADTGTLSYRGAPSECAPAAPSQEAARGPALRAERRPGPFSLEQLAGSLESLLDKQRQELLCFVREFPDGVRPEHDELDLPRDSVSGKCGAEGPPQGVPGCSRWPVPPAGGVRRRSSQSGRTVTFAEAIGQDQRGCQRPSLLSAPLEDDVGMSRIMGGGYTTSTSMFYRASRDLHMRAKRDSGWRAKLLRLTGHWSYELASGCAIFVNALVVAWETQFAAENRVASSPRHAGHFDVLMYGFCAMFAAELGMRILAQGSLFFYCMEYRWNVFDVVVVFGYIVEVLYKDSWLSATPALRVVRLARITRVAKALRSFTYFRELRVTVHMLVDSMIPLLTFAGVSAIVFLIFGIFFTDGATAYLSQHGKDNELSKYFGNLYLSMFTLSMSITGGIDWQSAVAPLFRLSWVYSAIFFVYMTFSLLAMLTTFNAIFIENVINRSKNDRDYVVQTELECKRDFMITMERLFEDLDRDNRGVITLQELSAQMMEPEVNAFFGGLELNVYKVGKMFRLMDTNSSGDIDKKEFINGCSRLRGDAKEIDLAILQGQVTRLSQDINNTTRMLHRLGEHVDRKFDQDAML